ncbi:glycosyltransferase, group 2 family protein [Selenomonas sp. oral taxon 892 str. F0426]|uniref:bifunctional glycosyltransferase/class I SAM-dependent methyltransferase n=1 Tax=Selenomonas sp. oral taxon 892 TaxID=1321785 RepID=UPI0003AD29E5|nr:bifunctional glycosyltransferase/class I SAM-dependent methyltransferase [Selenomonas sp. oral taxon 892]ERJ89484.1 glycosyltransferase, group 2 family protein [Selenomonas sp. oral taxon 892 str. F0426]
MAKLSIIIPVYNMSTQVSRCLLSIRKTVRLPYEVIIVDDGSSGDECVTVPPAGDDVRVLRSEEHRGFSHAVNVGIRASVGEVLLFLHADILLAPHTVEDMLDALIADPMMGAVTAISPRTYIWAEHCPDKEYHSWGEFITAAEDIRAQEKGKQLPLIVAEMFALMARRDVVDAAGFLEEEYSTPALAAYDYTVRMTREGYGIAVLASVYVHHDESIHAEVMESYEALRQQERELFRSKHGLSLDYSFQIRLDLIEMMDLQREGLRVLEIGCACGATLREIGHRNPTANLYGVELNEKAAEVAAPFATILSMDVERLDPAEIKERFDYIVMGDVVEHLLDPWAAIQNMRELLVPGGAIVASIPNVAHISNLYNVLGGRWTYEDMGLLDRTHFRFFTRQEIIKLFEGANLAVDEIRYKNIHMNSYVEKLREEILSLRTVHVDPEDIDAFQWLFRAVRE